MPRTSNFLTVATIDYVPQALVTLKSARRHNKDAGYYLFVPDATPESIKRLATILGDEFSLWINLFGPYDLGPERDRFLSAYEYYNNFEMSCFAKYVGIAHVLRASTAELCIYVDADILFLGDISDAVEEIDDKILLLTPHQLGPSTDDRENMYLIHGWLNGGIFCIRRDEKQTRPILDWLIHRVSRRGFYAPQYGMSGDQTWLSSLPFVFHDQTIVSQNPGLNVAYWNLDERELSRDGEKYRVRNAPLLVFHFSAFRPAELPRLSSYSDIQVASGSPLDHLCTTYKNELAAIAALGPRLKDLTRLEGTRKKIQDRILKGSIQNQFSLIEQASGLGLFSRIGRKLDRVLGKIEASIGASSGNDNRKNKTD